MSTFVLIHGGGHQARHWDRLRPLLEQRGHVTIAPDVPMSQVGKLVNDWADVVIDAIEKAGARDDVILVGHSLAGLALPVVAARFPVRRMVFLCALVPTPGNSWEEYLAAHPEASRAPHDRVGSDELGRLVYSRELAHEVFYQDCDPAEAEIAYSLVGPCATSSLTEKCPLDGWPDVPSTYILTQDDQLIGQEWSRQVSIDRLGGPALELPGGHSPMLSQRERLAALFDDIASP